MAAAAMAAYVTPTLYVAGESSVRNEDVEAMQAMSGSQHHDFDDEVVPALRKRLEEESRRLANRMSRLDSSSTQLYPVAANDNVTSPTRKRFQEWSNAPVSLLDETTWPPEDSSDFSLSSHKPARPSLAAPSGSTLTRRPSEILQDGLGSDELIPSEWATGSSARFRSPPPHTIGTSAGGSASFRTGLASQDPSYYSMSPSSSSHSISKKISPSKLDASRQSQDSVGAARERARRLAREKPIQHHPSPGTSPSASAQDHGDDVFYFNEDYARAKGRIVDDGNFRSAQELDDEFAFGQSGDPDGGEEDWPTQGRQRTISTPARPSQSHQRPSRQQQQQQQPRQAKKGLQEPRRPSTGATEPMTKERSTSIVGGRAASSKIPLPVSGSMAKYHPENSGQLRKSQSSGPLRSAFDDIDYVEPVDTLPGAEEVEELPQLRTTPPHQDGIVLAKPAEYPRSVSTSAAQKKKKNSAAAQEQPRSVSEKVPKRSTTKKLNNSPPTQDVLDEFGPLGGVPRSTRFGKDRDGSDDFAATGPQNPWDEEMLPVVAKRLAQEQMLAGDPRLSRVEGLIDTWDRDGNPLSKSMLVLKQRAKAEKEASDAAAAAAATTEGAEHGADTASLDEQGDEVGVAFSSYDADVASDKRSSRQPVQMQQRHRDKPGGNSRPEMIELTDARTRGQQQKGAPPPAQHQTSTSASQKPQAVQQPKTKAEQDDEGAGCCKCTIM